MGADGSTCTDRFIWKDIKDIFGAGKSIVHPEFRLAGSSDPGDNVGLPAENVSLYDH